MELMLIRHAQPAWVVDGAGALDPELTELGLRQAEHLAQAAQQWKKRPTHLWVSGARRSHQTVAPLAKVLQMQPVQHDWLTEIYLPESWQGAPALDIGAIFQGLKTRDEAAWWKGVPGGETYHDFHARVTGGLQAALSDFGVTRAAGEAPVYQGVNDDVRICLVAHGGTNSVLTSELLGLPTVPWSWERTVMAHAALTRIKSTPLLGGHIFGLREHSDAGHVPAGQRSR